MKIEIEIKDDELLDLVEKAVKQEVEGQVIDFITGDRMAFFWEIVNDKVDDYLKSERFGKLIRDTIRSSEDTLAEAIIQSMVGND